MTPPPRVNPKKASKTILRFDLFLNESLSGFLDVLPSDLAFAKRGDSAIFDRMKTEIPISKTDAMNGIRHPHCNQVFSGIRLLINRITVTDRMKASPDVLCIHEVRNPLLLSGECSAM